jgi:hypothetical protein
MESVLRVHCSVHGPGAAGVPFEHASAGLLSLLGLPESQVLGQPLLSLVAREDRATVMAALESLRAPAAAGGGGGGGGAAAPSAVEVTYSLEVPVSSGGGGGGGNGGGGGGCGNSGGGRRKLVVRSALRLSGGGVLALTRAVPH